MGYNRSNFLSSGQMGSTYRSRNVEVDISCARLPGRIKRQIGFHKPSVPPAIVISALPSGGIAAEAMANRGGGMNPNRGRGYSGGAGRGSDGGGRWNGGRGFGPGRGNNFFEGSSSGTAGDDAGSRNGGDLQGGDFDGVFRAGSGYRNNGTGQDRFNNAPNFHRGNDRRAFNGQGNYNNRRFNNSFSARDSGYRNNTAGFSARANDTEMLPDGLSAAQMLLVKETAAALAKQLTASQPQGAQATATMVTPSSGVPTATGSLAVPGDAPRRQGETEQRAEAVLLSVAGISAPQQQGTTPVLPEAAGDAHMAKKKKGSGCFRCGKPGHCLNDCTQNICDCCQSPDHLSRNCPLISAPKPTMVMYGLAHEDLMFWEFPFSGMVRPRLENTRMGRVTVSGGQLTIPEIITQLQWIVPEENYQWDVVMVEPNIYRVNFPSKIDLVRVQHFGRFNIPNSEMFMTFDFWTRSVEPAWTAEDVWVRVHDLPTPVLDDFLALWALGSLFGKTKDIDMAFTRANDILRICITCLNSSLIPTRMDVRVHEQFYRLRFEVEGLQPNIASDVHMDDAPNGDGDMEHDGHRENQEDEASRLGSQNDEEKNTTTGGTDVNIPGGANRLEVSPIKFGLLQPLEFMVESPMVTFSESVYEHIKETLGSRQQVVSVCDVQEDSPDEANMICASPVLLTEDLVPSGFQSETLTGQILLKPVQPVMHESTSIGEATSITPTQCATALSANASRAAVLDTMGKISIDDGKASSPSQCMTPVGVNKAFGATPICKPSMTEVISFGGITPNSMKGIRSSARLSAQPNADVSQMERAMMLASKRDDVQAQGYSTSHILDSSMGLSAPGGSAGEFGYWMQPSANGYSGLLFPGYWVAAH